MAAPCAARFACAGPLPRPQTPTGWELDKTTDVFDPAVHLQVEPPTSVKDLSFRSLPFPYSREEASKREGFAYCEPFPCLSPEGVRAARAAIDTADMRYSDIGKGNARAEHFVRGVAYTSQFMQDLVYDKTLIDLLSDMARTEVWPHTMTMSAGHTNIGRGGTGKPVDRWHTDSVDYVLIIILSDVSEMEGGLLRILQQPDATGAYFKDLQTNGVPPELVEVVRHTRPGYGIFMQGSKILHEVTPVVKAGKEPRYSLVNSYMPRDVFAADRTKYHTFAKDGFGDRGDVLPVEFARHKAWRIKGRMAYILDDLAFGSKPEEIAQMLQAAGDELQQAARLLRGEENDNASWVEEEDVEVAQSPCSAAKQ